MQPSKEGLFSSSLIS